MILSSFSQKGSGWKQHNLMMIKSVVSPENVASLDHCFLASGTGDAACTTSDYGYLAFSLFVAGFGVCQFRHHLGNL
ncbi:hypothetical protein V6N13_129941 [Hibiscus sabdariffa]